MKFWKHKQFTTNTAIITDIHTKSKSTLSIENNEKNNIQNIKLNILKKKVINHSPQDIIDSKLNKSKENNNIKNITTNNKIKENQIHNKGSIGKRFPLSIDVSSIHLDKIDLNKNKNNNNPEDTISNIHLNDKNNISFIVNGTDNSDRKIQDKFAGTLSLIIDNFLYISGEKAAHNLNELKDKKITHIINCAGKSTTNRYPSDIIYHTLYLRDNLDENLEPHFLKFINYVENVKNNKGVILVHCKMGISRAPSMVIAYIMWLNKLKYQDAFNYIQKRRPVIGPNIGFIEELYIWEKKINQKKEISSKLLELNNNSNLTNDLKIGEYEIEKR